MSRRTVVLFAFFAFFVLPLCAPLGAQTPASCLDLPGRDLHCGMKAYPSPAGGTGYFRVEKDVHNRWLFVTPEGNYFWMIASYTEDPKWLQTTPTNVLTVKYGGNKTNWAKNNNSRLLAWNFNTIGEYATTYTMPVNTNRSHSNASAIKLPFVPIINAIVSLTLYPTDYGLAERPKNMIKGFPSTRFHIYTGGRTTDMFSPLVAAGYPAVIAFQNTTTFTDGLASSSWTIGITPDDTDYLFGLKNRGDAPVSQHPNLGFVTAVGAFNYTGIDGTWIDPKLYTKYAWACGISGIDFGYGVGSSYLQQKYHNNVSELNTAWVTGGFYTSFCDAGGYGLGTGVLDEDGRHSAWMGADSGNNYVAYLLTGTNPNVAADLNQWVYEYAYRYAHIAVSAIKAVDSHHLIFGPASLGGSGYMDRPQVLQAFADAGMDVIQMSASPTGDFTGHKATYDLIGKPIYLWYGISANNDSALYGYVSGQGVPDYGSQANRATHYATDLQSFLAAQATNGDNYLLGIDWWEHEDGSFAEKTNWGLVTDRDNAYDGREDVNYPVTDRGGYTTVPEDRTYGNFVGPVTATNLSILQQIIPGGGSGGVYNRSASDAFALSELPPTLHPSQPKLVLVH